MRDGDVMKNPYDLYKKMWPQLVEWGKARKWKIDIEFFKHTDPLNPELICIECGWRGTELDMGHVDPPGLCPGCSMDAQDLIFEICPKCDGKGQFHKFVNAYQHKNGVQTGTCNHIICTECDGQGYLE